MRREGQIRLFLLRANALRFSSISPVFRREDVLALARIEIAVRPAEVVTPIDAREEFRGQFVVLLHGVELRPMRAQMVAPV